MKRRGEKFTFLLFLAIVFSLSNASAAFAPTFDSSTPTNASNTSVPIVVGWGQESFDDSSRGYGFLDFNRDLRVWLKFDGNYVDSSTYGLTVTNQSNATLNNAVFKFGNGSLLLNYSLAKLTLPANISGIIDPYKGYTLSVWLMPLYPNDGGVIAGTINGAYNGTYWRFNNATTGDGQRLNQAYGAPAGGAISSLVLRSGSPGLENNTYLWPNGTWTHVAIVHYNEDVKLYVNGVLRGGNHFPFRMSCGPINCINRSGISFYIGNPFGGIPSFQAYYDEFMLFSRPLVSGEIGALYDYASAANSDFIGSPIFTQTNGTKFFTAYVVNQSGNVTSTETRTITALNSGPYFYQVNSSFSNNSYGYGVNKSYSAILPTNSFYGNTIGILNNSLLQARLYYRTSSTSSWQLLGNQTWRGFFNPSDWSGRFGDSIMGQGDTGAWPRFLDGYTQTDLYQNSSLQYSVGGYKCSQVYASFVANSTNNTKALMNCGVNDANTPTLDMDSILANISSIVDLAYQRNVSLYVVGVTPHFNESICTRIYQINEAWRNHYEGPNATGIIKGYADVFNSTLKNSNNCSANLTYYVDGIHPNDDGRMIIAKLVYERAFRGFSYNGFYNEFTPTQNGTYDLNWTLTTSTGETSETIFSNLFSFLGTLPLSDNSTEENDSEQTGGGAAARRARELAPQIISESDLSSGYTGSLYVNGVYRFKVRNVSHTIILNAYTADSASITIRSDPLDITLSRGNTEHIDLDGDSEKDLILRYDGVQGSTARIFVQQAPVVSPVQNQTVTQELLDQDESSNSFLLLAVIVAVLVVVISLIVYFLKNKR